MQSMLSKLGFAQTLDTRCVRKISDSKVTCCIRIILGFTAHTDGKIFQWKEQGLYIGNTKISVTGCQLHADA